LEDLGVDRQYVKTEKRHGRAWDELIWLWIGTTGGLVRPWNKHSGYIKCGEFLNLPRNYQLRKMGYAPWSLLGSHQSGILVDSEERSKDFLFTVTFGHFCLPCKMLTEAGEKKSIRFK
jgi:hypothetical protein